MNQEARGSLEDELRVPSNTRIYSIAKVSGLYCLVTRLLARSRTYPLTASLTHHLLACSLVRSLASPPTHPPTHPPPVRLLAHPHSPIHSLAHPTHLFTNPLTCLLEHSLIPCLRPSPLPPSLPHSLKTLH